VDSPCRIFRQYIDANYDSINRLWGIARRATKDTEMKARIQGIKSQMKNFEFLFCLILTEMILRHTDKLSQTLQKPKLSSVEGHTVAMLTVKTLESLRTDDNFDTPKLSRKRKVPKRFEHGNAAEFSVSPNYEFRLVYFEALDLAVGSIHKRFDQKSVCRREFRRRTGCCLHFFLR
jgi:hypothetical protein